MRKLSVLIVAILLVCGVATSAMAVGNGTIIPLGIGKVRVQSGNGTINPLAD